MDAIPFKGQVRESSVERLLLQLRHPDSTHLVYVNSPGGTFEFFSRLGPAVERQGATMIAGEVASAAVVLYLLGHRRQATPDSTFFFHEVRALTNLAGEITIVDLEDAEEYEQQMSQECREYFEWWRSQMRSAQAWFVQYMSRRTGLAVGTFLNLMRSETTLSAREAQRYGIVHEVISSAPYQFSTAH